MADAYALMRRKMMMMHEKEPTKLRRFEQHAGPIPDELEKSFLAMNSLPEGCDAQAVSKVLCEGSAEAFGWWWVLFAATKGDTGALAALADPTIGEKSRDRILEQLMDESPERLKWFWEAPIGSIQFSKKLPETEFLASFTNAAQYPLPVPAGGMHVAVGFVDLGELAETLAAQQKAPDSGQGVCMRWVGILKSAYCCAKALVILHMLQRGIPSHIIAQVWYSAGWTASTADAFHASVAALLEDPHGSALRGETAGVEEWLRVWKGRKVPLAKARAAWLDRNGTSSASIANLLRKDDRMAYCYSSVCGDVDVLPVKTEGNEIELVSTGSVVMFAEPRGFSHEYEYAMHENFLFTFPADDLVQERLMQSRTFHAAGAVLARRRVEALAAALHTNRVSIEIRHVALSDDFGVEVSAVRALEPSSMSWRNLCDYRSPSSFHRLARRCSIPSTQHFVHSINWCLDIKGAFVLDYGFPPDDSDPPLKGREAIEEKERSNTRRKILQDARQTVKQSVKSRRAERLLRVVPLDNTLNVCDSLLQQRMAPRWLEAFCGEAPSTGKGSIASWEVLHSPEYWSFKRSNAVMHLRLQYR